jgi:D-alanyl-D-alanine carboxypeptidase
MADDVARSSSSSTAAAVLDEILFRRLRMSTTSDDSHDKMDDRRPGVQVTIVSHGSILYSSAMGSADPTMPPNPPLTPHHRSNLYSVTKFFTASCTLKLIEQEQLKYDSNVRKLLPDHWKPHVNDWCTVGNLITHTAGVPNPMPLAWVHAMTQDKEETDEQSLLEKVLQNNPFHTVKPSTLLSLGGEKTMPAAPYRYSNVGYWILGYIVTKTCGNKPMQEFDKCCEELLFSSLPKGEKLRIDSTFAAKDLVAPGHLRRYSAMSLVAWLFCPKSIMEQEQQNKHAYIRINQHNFHGSAYGGLIGSSLDVASYLGCMDSVLSAPSIQMLLTPLRDTNRNHIQ